MQKNNNAKRSHFPLPIRSLHQGTIIAKQYKLVDKLGHGSFGQIFKAEHIENKKLCAVKFEKREELKNQVSLLQREIKVLLELKGLPGFPEIYFYGRDEHYNYFMISLLGQNYEELIRKCGGKFSIWCTIRIAIQILTRIKQFHEKYLIHRDIKPENLVVGNDDITQLYLIDFGLSKYYRDDVGNHIKAQEKKGIIGTARYASINALSGKEQSRKDDLESISYVLVYFAKGKLPWMAIDLEDKQKKYQKIKEMKENITSTELCSDLPNCFKLYLDYVQALQFTDQPDYQLMKAYFEEELSKMSKIMLNAYDWEILAEYKNKVRRRSGGDVYKQINTSKEPDLSTSVNAPKIRKNNKPQITIQPIESSPLEQIGLNSKNSIDSCLKNNSRINNYSNSQLQDDGNIFSYGSGLLKLKEIDTSINQHYSMSQFKKQDQSQLVDKEFDDLDIIARDESPQIKKFPQPFSTKFKPFKPKQFI